MGLAAGDTNLERYVGNSPVNCVDPSGLEGEFQPGPVRANGPLSSGDSQGGGQGVAVMEPYAEGPVFGMMSKSWSGWRGREWLP